VNIDTQEPYDTLTMVAVDWCRSVGSNANKVSDIIDNRDEKVCVLVCVCVRVWVRGFVSTYQRGHLFEYTLTNRRLTPVG